MGFVTNKGTIQLDLMMHGLFACFAEHVFSREVPLYWFDNSNNLEYAITWNLIQFGNNCTHNRHKLYSLSLVQLLCLLLEQLP